MTGKPNPTENFLISSIAASLVGFLRPAWYVMRSDMGIQHTAMIPIIISGFFYGGRFSVLSMTSTINARVIIFFVVLFVLGYLRNNMQARRRRRERDWSVNTWSSGKSLLIPLFLFLLRRVYQRTGNKEAVRRLARVILHEDFIYYVGEPSMLLLAALAMRSIGSTLFYYPIGLAVACIVVRNDDKLWLYLKAHEIPDGKMLENAIKTEFEGPTRAGTGAAIATVAEPSGEGLATDSESVFARLSPELQSLLRSGRAAHGK